jgi:glycine C-acetyltransferase
MNTQRFFETLTQEIARIDEIKTAKRKERIIEGFTNDPSPRAIIEGKPYLLFNSNDYLGMRHQEKVKQAEHVASKTFGAGPGAVRFISGTVAIHRELEKTIAAFHNRPDAIIISSAFAANLAVIFCLSQGLTKDSLVTPDVLIISDALNHRSIIDGVRLTGLAKEQRVIFEHMNPKHLDEILTGNHGKYKRVIIVTDGVFSMLGEYQDLKQIRQVIHQHDKYFPQGILLVVDDCHGVGVIGETGRGIEEIEQTQADVLVGTFGKAFGADGGYIVANQTIIDYLRESAPTYIYSNAISPGTAGAALEAVSLLTTQYGKQLLKKLQQNTNYFKKQMNMKGFTFAADSNHPIQPLLIGDSAQTKQYVELLFEQGILVTGISYPVVAKGKDEIRIQISATHTQADIDYAIHSLEQARRHIHNA